MSYSSKKSIVVVDDHPFILEGVVQVIKKIADYEVVGTAVNGQEGLAVCLGKTPDIVVADIDMPEKDGVEMVRELKDNYNWVKVIFLTSHVNLDTFRKAIELDYSGFLFKESALNELEGCLQRVQKDERYLGEGVSDFIEANKAEIENFEKLDAVFNDLTKSELKVLKQIAEGKTTSHIAETLFNSVKTIENHRYNICRKLGVDGSNGLLCFAIENRLYIQNC
ncbi:response regulator transcription factor [Labilibacter marinus]|uniref:response regulator transcription factor n=1 Tax=Labilibacter marinus TaxID=1477105 RepID=UPI000834239F|nr:response regulator transcription factor [Labilibacter marinus]